MEEKLKLYVLVTMVVNTNDQKVAVELTMASRKSIIEMEALEKALFDYPLEKGWKEHSTVAYQLAFDSLLSPEDEKELYVLVRAYKKDGYWNSDVKWALFNQTNEMMSQIEAYINEWVDTDNNIYPDDNKVSIVANPIPNKTRLFFNVLNWKPWQERLVDFDNLSQSNQLQDSLLANGNDILEDDEDSLVM